MTQIDNLIRLLDLAIRVTDLLQAGSISYEEYKETVDRINLRLRRARDEGREVGWDDVESAQDKLDDIIARGRG